MSLRAAEQERGDVAQARRAWQDEAEGVGGVSPERLVFPAKPEVCAWTSAAS